MLISLLEHDVCETGVKVYDKQEADVAQSYSFGLVCAYGYTKENELSLLLHALII